jgi:ABC-type multidrug transport system fused ATPase/permease subunit
MESLYQQMLRWTAQKVFEAPSPDTLEYARVSHQQHSPATAEVIDEICQAYVSWRYGGQPANLKQLKQRWRNLKKSNQSLAFKGLSDNDRTYREPQRKPDESCFSPIQQFLITWLLILVTGWVTLFALSYVGELLSILITAGLIAFLLNYAVTALRRFLPRSVAAGLVYLLAGISVLVIALTVVPPVFNQARQLVLNLPFC